MNVSSTPGLGGAICRPKYYQTHIILNSHYLTALPHRLSINESEGKTAVRKSVMRKKVHFHSRGVECAAWYYPSQNGTCVIMAGGLGVTKEPAADRFADRLHKAGHGVLTFDYRNFGESGGTQRQLARFREQVADWQAVIEFAPTLPGVDPDKLAAWGYSSSGGHMFTVAARNPQLAAAIAHAPLTDGPNGAPNAFRHMTPIALTRITARAIADAIGGALGRDPLLVPLAGERGSVALLTIPDAGNSAPALNPGNKYPDWQQEASASAWLRLGSYRPGRHASAIRCPLLVIVHDEDDVAPAEPAARAAQQAPRGEVVRLPGGHYGSYLDAYEQAVETLLSFLDRRVAHP
ncbi:alpha/beta hydrolase [Nocardia sp. CA-107356]|uniref:alpha/beta hydrolase n=1 Tax=Nocardia sp. CA-107356 TaxID=3239972 RepID=UPI003D8AF4BA